MKRTSFIVILPLLALLLLAGACGEDYSRFTGWWGVKNDTQEHAEYLYIDSSSGATSSIHITYSNNTMLFYKETYYSSVKIEDNTLAQTDIDGRQVVYKVKNGELVSLYPDPDSENTVFIRKPDAPEIIDQIKGYSPGYKEKFVNIAAEDGRPVFKLNWKNQIFEPQEALKQYINAPSLKLAYYFEAYNEPTDELIVMISVYDENNFYTMRIFPASFHGVPLMRLSQIKQLDGEKIYEELDAIVLQQF